MCVWRDVATQNTAHMDVNRRTDKQGHCSGIERSQPHLSRCHEWKWGGRGVKVSIKHLNLERSRLSENGQHSTCRRREWTASSLEKPSTESHHKVWKGIDWIVSEGEEDKTSLFYLASDMEWLSPKEISELLNSDWHQNSMQILCWHS